MLAHALSALVLITGSFVGVAAMASDGQDRETVARLDREFQAAVKVNDANTMGRILGEDMTLVLGNGTINSRDELLQEARSKAITYEEQDEDLGTQRVRIWGNTAVVTARLWVKGTRKGGGAFDRRLWFSDVYVKTPSGWRYVFGQASIHLPDPAEAVAPRSAR